MIASTIAAVLAGALVAKIEGGPILFATFKGPLASFAISAVIGVTAGLSCADDAGRRYLIGVAGAVQFAVSLLAWARLGERSSGKTDHRRTRSLLCD